MKDSYKSSIFEIQHLRKEGIVGCAKVLMPTDASYQI